MSKPSPTSLSIDYLYSQGYSLVCKVEHWNAFARIRQDYAGFIDLIAHRRDEILGIQVTSRANVSSRVKKIEEHENLPHLRESGMRVEVHGWDKGPEGWRLKVVDLS